MRAAVAVLAGLAALPAVPAAAQPPPLTIVAPAAPGGGWDQTARAMQRALAAPGAVVQVENVPGAAGTIGLARFVTAERGRPEALLVTGLVMVGAIATTGSAVSLADATPIARLTGEWEVIVVPADSPHRTLRDLLDALVAAPASVSWGGGSAGGTDDLLVRLVAEAVDVPPAAANYVAFAGGGEALAAVLGGQVTAGVSGVGEFGPSIAAGQLRVLAISSPRRDPLVNAPTLRESGLDLEVANWRAVVAPPGISASERDALTARVRAMAESASWRETLTRTGWTDAYLDGAAFEQFLLAEQARVQAVLGRLRQHDAPPPRARWQPTSRSAPLVALTALAALTLAQWRPWRRRAPAAPARGDATDADSAPAVPATAPAVLLVAALAGQALVMPVVGFVPAATAVFALTSRALGSRRPWRDVGVGVALTTLLAIVFAWGLDAPLPREGSWR
ncbi:MAG: tripartite tricarboxylate transporter substrate-binding protein [Vicinamibacterales bacterium]